MPLNFNLRHIEEDSLFLKGQLAATDLELEALDELIHVNDPLLYDLEIQKLEDSVLVQGTLTLKLDCECVRCLKPFRKSLKIEDWACHLPLQGDEKVEVVNDSVDLTPYIREDIVLAFPQHPLCKLTCRGLVGTLKKKGQATGAETSSASAWAALDKLKLKK